jgi:hypothetical protein
MSALMQDHEVSRRTVVLFWLAFGIAVVLGAWWVNASGWQAVAVWAYEMLSELQRSVSTLDRPLRFVAECPPGQLVALANATIIRIVVFYLVVVAMLIFWSRKIRAQRNDKEQDAGSEVVRTVDRATKQESVLLWWIYGAIVVISSCLIPSIIYFIIILYIREPFTSLSLAVFLIVLVIYITWCIRGRKRGGRAGGP